jgi:hypothetical protein
MRLCAPWVLVGVFVAGVLALPAGANHERITLHAVDSHLVLSGVATGEPIPVRFTWAPEDTLFESSNVMLCWNGHFDRARLADDVKNWDELCSSSATNGSNIASHDQESFTSATYDALDAGRYEAVIRRETRCESDCYPPLPPHWNVSNVVTVEVVDPCRFELESVTGKVELFPLLVGAPVPCEAQVNGELRVRAEDGTRVALKSKAAYLRYDTQYLKSSPVLRLATRGSGSSISFETKGALAHLVTSASTQGGHVLAVSPASVTMTGKNGVGRIHVNRGRVVALGVGVVEVQDHIAHYCGEKHPTIACLSKIRYRFFTMKRGTSIKARVLRAGQSATFRKRTGWVKFVG